MWAVARGVVVWLFGDKVLKYVAYFVVGLLAAAYLEATAATTAIFAQPFGQHWLAAMGGTPSFQPTGAVDLPLAPAPGVNLDRATLIVSNAMRWLGTRYLWGGCSRSGVDCSCFVQNVLRAAGVAGVPRNTLTQIAWTRPVPFAQAQATDLLYFDNTCTGCGGNPTHVGIYLGDSQMVHCGDPCRIERIDTPHWRSHLNSVGRIPS